MKHKRTHHLKKFMCTCYSFYLLGENPSTETAIYFYRFLVYETLLFIFTFFLITSILLCPAVSFMIGVCVCVCVCVCRLSSERLSSRLRASDFVLMAERSTVLYVPSGHTYLSRKTGYSTPPLHTPRQHYTHTHMTHTHCITVA